MIRAAPRTRSWASVWAVLAIALPALGCSGQDRDAASAGGAERAARPAPDFTLPDLDGQPISLADYRGKTVIVDFWATWCLPCVYQIPVLNEFWNAHREAGDVAVIGVSVDTDGVEVVAPWVAEQGVEYPIVLGDERLAREFGAMGFPTLAVITPDGRIDSLHVGLIELEELESLVARFADSS